MLLARQFAFLFHGVEGPQAGKALHLMKPDELVRRLKCRERIVTLDVRTPAEAAIYGMTLPETLAIPINRLFMPNNLRRVPRNARVVVACKSGTRATAAGTAMRAVGFNLDPVFEPRRARRTRRGSAGYASSRLHPPGAREICEAYLQVPVLLRVLLRELRVLRG
jgi:rhodanese-related sulfurtransferase